MTKKVNLTKEGLFNAVRNPAIKEGMCAVLHGDKLLYKGRIGSSPDVTGREVHLHPKDYEHLQRHVKKHRH